MKEGDEKKGAMTEILRNSLFWNFAKSRPNFLNNVYFPKNVLKIWIEYLKVLLPKTLRSQCFRNPSCDEKTDYHRPYSKYTAYTRLKPTCDKKIGIMGLVYIINQ